MSKNVRKGLSKRVIELTYTPIVAGKERQRQTVMFFVGKEIKGKY